MTTVITSTMPAGEHALALYMATMVRTQLDALDWPNALHLAEQLAVRFPMCDDAQTLYGKCYMVQGKWRAAQAILRRARRAPGRFLLARACFELEEYPEAEQAIAEPIDASGEVRLRKDVAVAVGNDVVWLDDPPEAPVYQLLGEIYRRTERIALALTCFDQALRRNPFLWTVYESMCDLGASADRRPASHYFNGPAAIPAVQLAAAIHACGPTRAPAPAPPASSKEPANKRQRIDQTPQTRSTRLAGAPLTARKPSSLNPDRVPLSRLGAPAQSTPSRSSAAAAAAAPPDPDPYTDPDLLAAGLSGIMHVFATFGDAYQHLKRAQFKRARSILHGLPPRHLSSPWGQRLVGTVHFEARQFNVAVQHFENVGRAAPWVTQDMDMYSTALWFCNRTGIMNALATRIQYYDDLAPEAWVALGNYYSHRKQSEKAVDALKHAVEMRPRYAYGWLVLGIEYLQMKKVDLANEAFLKVVGLDSHSHKAWSGLGNVARAKGQIHMAEFYFEKAEEVCPLALYASYRGLISEDRDQFADAIQHYKTAVERDPHTAVFRLHLARALIKAEQAQELPNEPNYDEPLQLLDMLQREVPTEANVHQLLAVVYDRLAQYDECLLAMHTAASCYTVVPPTVHHALDCARQRRPLSLNELLVGAGTAEILAQPGLAQSPPPAPLRAARSPVGSSPVPVPVPPGLGLGDD
ncbi:anaphase-promoting complex subunit cdc27 [Allomyces javanicus]|nr:anaphase-promoting complex subunit cdc27 [Allomyces javanicus]